MRLIQLIRPPKRSIFNIHDLDGVKLLNRLPVEFCDLCSHRFNHNFHCADPSCLCKTGIEDDENFLLHCPRFSSQRKGFLDLLFSLTGTEDMRLSSKELCRLLLYGLNDLSVTVSRGIIEKTIKFIRSTRRFEKHGRFSLRFSLVTTAITVGMSTCALTAFRLCSHLHCTVVNIVKSYCCKCLG